MRDYTADRELRDWDKLAAYLDIDGIEVTFGHVTALQSLSLKIEEGEFFCLLGPSGCGKSTTLNVVAGFFKPRRGRVRLVGEDVTDLPPQRRHVGVVFQSYALFPHMTVAANVGYGLKIQKRARSEIEARVTELLSLVRLEGKEDRYPRQLSGGEQQRVAIARALAVEPRLLLLDEPLSNLDARLREEMRVELKRIQRTTGVTTIFVTHDQEEAIGTSDRIAVLNQGRLEQVGTPNEIYRAPKTLFVARFIGRSNPLHVTLDGGSKPPRLHLNGHDFVHAQSPTDHARKQILFLRPEEMLLTRTPKAPNSVAGRVSEITYGGTIITYRIETGIGELEASQLGESTDGFAVGDSVHVGWMPDAGVLLPEK